MMSQRYQKRRLQRGRSRKKPDVEKEGNIGERERERKKYNKQMKKTENSKQKEKK